MNPGHVNKTIRNIENKWGYKTVAHHHHHRLLSFVDSLWLLFVEEERMAKDVEEMNEEERLVVWSF